MTQGASHPFPNHDIRAYLATNKSQGCLKNGGGSWNYLQSTRLYTPVVIPDVASGSAWSVVSTAISTTKADRQFDTLQKSWEKHEKVNFDKFINNYTMAKTKGQGPDNDPHLISLWCSTSVVMQIMQHIGYTNAQKILGYRLSGVADLDKGSKETAEKKVKKLCQLIDRLNKDSGGELKGVVLFNSRVGDMNKQHNATTNILGQVAAAATNEGYNTIAILQIPNKDILGNYKSGIVDNTGGKPKSNNYIYDLLDITTASGERMDDRIKAYFWHLVASFIQGDQSPLGKTKAEQEP